MALTEMPVLDAHGAWNQAIMDIDPEFAEAILAKYNGRNRPLSPAHVIRLANEILEGRWQVLPNGIIFDPDNNLLDGQHRLAAVVRTGRTVQMTVTYDVDPKVFAAMDSVVKVRSAGDVLALNSGSTKYRSAIPAALRLLRNYEREVVGGSSSQVSHTEMIELSETWPEMEQMCRVSLLTRSRTGLNANAIAAGLALTARDNPSVSQTEWLNGIVLGANLAVGDPRLALRNVGASATHAKKAPDLLPLYIKAFNAWLLGDKVKSLRVSPSDRFPMPKRLDGQRHGDKVGLRSIIDFSAK